MPSSEYVDNLSTPNPSIYLSQTYTEVYFIHINYLPVTCIILLVEMEPSVYDYFPLNVIRVTLHFNKCICAKSLMPMIYNLPWRMSRLFIKYTDAFRHYPYLTYISVDNEYRFPHFKTGKKCCY
jgi:hypothetical protein